ncbi:hypothetical protein EI94DRAFT_1761060, partial [Lactarius quietus]
DRCMFDQEVHRIRLGIRALALSVWLSVFALSLSETPSPSSRLPLPLSSHFPAHGNHTLRSAPTSSPPPLLTASQP